MKATVTITQPLLDVENGTGDGEVLTAIVEFANVIKGDKGDTGKSAYQIWLDAGNQGTESDFLASLKGQDGTNGTNGTNGADGKSAYELWLEAGNSGTLEQFLGSLKGEDGQDGTNGTNGTNGSDGKSAYELWLEAGNSGTMQQFLASLVGPTGPDGKSAYQIWLDAGNTGTEADFLASLVGPTGPSGTSSFTHTANASVSSATTTVTFAANQRGSQMISVSADIDITFDVRNLSDNYLWIKNTGSSKIDVTISSVVNDQTAVSNVYVPADGISVPAGGLCEIGIVRNADGVFITSRNDLEL